MPDQSSSPGPPHLPLPLWVRIADGVAVVVLSLWAMVAAFGGFRAHLFGLRLSLTSAPRLLIFAAVLLVVRHLIVRRDPLYGRFGRAIAGWWNSTAVRAVLPIWFATRFGVLAMGYLGVVTIGYPPGAPPFRIFENEFLNLPVRWDVGWYLGIAIEGYHWSPDIIGQQNIAFMPGLPMLMRVGGRLLDSEPLLAGQIVVLGASLAAFVYLFRLALDLIGDEERAAATVGLLAAYPFSVFYSAIYTESLFVLGSVAAFYYYRRRELWKAGLCALLVGLTRPNGFLLGVCLAVMALWPELTRFWFMHRKAPGAGARRARPVRDAAMLLACGFVGLAAFSAFIYTMTGRPLAWLEAHAAWGRTYKPLTELMATTYNNVAGQGLYEYSRSLPLEAVQGVAVLAALGAVWPVARRYGPAYALFIVANLIPAMLAGGFMSVGRITSTLFPMFVLAGAACPPRHRVAWMCGFAMLQAVCAMLFFTWRPMF